MFSNLKKDLADANLQLNVAQQNVLSQIPSPDEAFMPMQDANIHQVAPFETPYHSAIDQQHAYETHVNTMANDQEDMTPFQAVDVYQPCFQLAGMDYTNLTPLWHNEQVVGVPSLHIDQQQSMSFNDSIYIPEYEMAVHSQHQPQDYMNYPLDFIPQEGMDTATYHGTNEQTWFQSQQPFY